MPAGPSLPVVTLAGRAAVLAAAVSAPIRSLSHGLMALVLRALGWAPVMPAPASEQGMTVSVSCSV